MRIFFFAAMLGMILGTAASGQAQKEKKTPPSIEEKKKDPTSFVTDIAGRTLEQYIKDISSKDRSKAETAVRTVVMFGPERAAQAIPVMLAELEKHTSSFPIDLSLRINIPTALSNILINIKDPDPKQVHRTILVLTRLVRADSQAIVKYRAAQALANFGPEARSAIPELIAMMRDTAVWENRQMAAMALGAIGQDPKSGPPPEILRALYLTLRDSASQVRLAAIQSLTWLGPPANPNDRTALENALQPLALKDPEPSLQIWANMAIMSVTSNIASERVNAIVKMLQQHPDASTRIQAAKALGMIGTKAKGTVPYLTAALGDSEANVVNMSIWALMQMKDGAVNALPTLEKIRDDPKQIEALREAAKEACDIITGKKKTEDKKGAQP